MTEAAALEALAALGALVAGGAGFALGRAGAARPAPAPAAVRMPPVSLASITPEALLGRTPQLADVSFAARRVAGASVLVTGAGGSIGGELSRQLIALGPRRLVLLGHGENSLFAIHRELIAKGADPATLRVVVADVGDAARIRAVFAQERPQLVFHAAAHKHVPLCEENACEAVRNNVLGTRVLAMAAAAAGTACVVMISTDKAVNPTSVMGATKRVAETICRSIEIGAATAFVSVRFGNVLGSRGSVVPVFAEQIAAGGPVTITHREMTRYFMTIPEAVSLILAAGTSARDGEVCVLDMGEPVRVYDLAERLIRAMGREPHRDIAIVETGLRPGEKLYEEMLTADEGVTATTLDRVFVARSERIDYGAFAPALDRLIAAARRDDAHEVVRTLSELVPTFQPGAHWNVRSRAVA